MGTDPSGVPAADYRALKYLHPYSPLFRIVNDLRKAVVPLVALFALRGRLELWYLVFIVPSAIYSLVQYLALRYRFAEDELVVKQGLIFRNERHIPFQRIQNIDLVQTVLHRAAGVAEVRIETASGTEPEAILQVLSLSAVEEMRDRVFSDRRTAVPDQLAESPSSEGDTSPASQLTASDRRTILDLPVSELIRLGLISNRGIALVGAAVGLIWEFYFAGQYEPPWTPEILVLNVGELTFPAFSALVIGGAAIAGFAALLLLSVVWIIVRLYGFKLERIGEDLRIEAGLFTRVSATIPRGRIQFLSVRASPLHRLFGRVSVKVETAGADANETSSITRQWFIPILPAADLDRVLSEVHPEFWPEQPDWKPISPGALRRKLKRAAVLPVFFSFVALFIWWGLAVLLISIWLPLAFWHATLSTRRTQWATTSAGILFRDGVIIRRTSATLLEKIQVVSTSRTPFDLRRGMASVRVDTAGSSVVSHKIAIPMLDDPVAEALRLDLARHAAASDFVW